MSLICCDTSIFIEYDRTKRGVLVELLEEASRVNHIVSISSVVLFEFWGGESIRSKKSQMIAEELFKDFKIIDITGAIAKRAGRLKDESRMDSIDALIAATAIEHRAQLATLNTKHFKHIPDLKLWTPKVILKPG